MTARPNTDCEPTCAVQLSEWWTYLLAFDLLPESFMGCSTLYMGCSGLEQHNVMRSNAV